MEAINGSDLAREERRASGELKSPAEELGLPGRRRREGGGGARDAKKERGEARERPRPRSVGMEGEAP